MKKYVKCKVCGYVMEEKFLKEVCPVCGVPKTAFIEYKDNISEKRRKILNLHIHPISVHFPETISVLSVPFLFIAYLTTGTLSNYLLETVKTLQVILPFTIVLAILSGIYDGKIRYKKLSPPYLKFKIYVGSILLVLSIIAAILSFNPLNTSAVKVIFFVLLLINLALSGILGKLGGTMLESKMSGK